MLIVVILLLYKCIIKYSLNYTKSSIMNILIYNIYRSRP